MAKLKDEDFDIEICLVKLDDYEWIYYEIDINIQGKPVLNRQALWDKGDDKEQIQCSARTEDYQKDGLLKFIRTILTTNEPDYFEPTELVFSLRFILEYHFHFQKRIFRELSESGTTPTKYLKIMTKTKGSTSIQSFC